MADPEGGGGGGDGGGGDLVVTVREVRSAALASADPTLCLVAQVAFGVQSGVVSDSIAVEAGETRVVIGHKAAFDVPLQTSEGIEALANGCATVTILRGSGSGGGEGGISGSGGGGPPSSAKSKTEGNKSKDKSKSKSRSGGGGSDATDATATGNVLGVVAVPLLSLLYDGESHSITVPLPLNVEALGGKHDKNSSSSGGGGSGGSSSGGDGEEPAEKGSGEEAGSERAIGGVGGGGGGGGIVAELDLRLTVSRPVLSEEQRTKGNLLTLTTSGLFSPPEALLGASSTSAAAAAAAGSSVTLSVALPNNSISKTDAWAGGTGAGSANASGSPPSRLALTGGLPGPALPETAAMLDTALEVGAMRGADDVDFRREAESARPRVTWPSGPRGSGTMRLFLTSSDVAALKNEIASTRRLAVRVSRHGGDSSGGSSEGGSGGGGKSKSKAKSGGSTGENTSGAGTHVAHGAFAAAALMYPGVAQARCAVPLGIPLEAVVLDSNGGGGGGGGGGGAGVAAVADLGSATTAAANGVSAAGSGETPAPSKTKSKGGGGGAAAAAAAASAAAAARAEAEAYAKARSYAVVTLALQTPLVPRRTRAQLAADVAELIPPRPNLPRVGGSAEGAVAGFKAQVASLARELVVQYRQHAVKHTEEADDGASGPGPGPRRSLLHALNVSGQYAAFKEQLKRRIVAVVRERFRRTSALEAGATRQAFLDELYVYLAGQVHEALNENFAFDHAHRPTPLKMDATRLLALATEAEVNGDLEAASHLFLEAAAEAPADESGSSCWFEAGRFYSRAGDSSRAEECLREAVAIVPTHREALLLCGLLLARDVATRGEGNVLLEAATAVEEDEAATKGQLFGNEFNKPPPGGDFDPLLWCIRAQQHARAGEIISAERCNSFVDYEGDKGEDICLRAVEWLSRGGCYELAHTALAAQRVLGHRGTSTSQAEEARYNTARARLLLDSRPNDEKGALEAEALIESSLAADYTNPGLWALLGHALYSRGNHAAAAKAYQHSLDLPEEADKDSSADATAAAATEAAGGAALVRLRLAGVRLADENFEAARDLYLTSCTHAPSAASWRGAGVALYRLGKLQQAEEALAEANLYNSGDAVVWAYLALVCLRDGRRVEAEQAYKHATRIGLNDATLVNELELEQHEAGFGNPFLDA